MTLSEQNLRTMDMLLMKPPCRIGNPEYRAWMDCVRVATEMVDGKFIPIGIYEDSKGGRILYPTYFHAHDGKKRDWTPKKVIKKVIAGTTHYFEEAKNESRTRRSKNVNT